jgi:hypothetical protein
MVEKWWSLAHPVVENVEVVVTSIAALEAIVEDPRHLMSSMRWSDAPRTLAQPLAFSVDRQTQGIAIPR